MDLESPYFRSSLHCDNHSDPTCESQEDSIHSVGVTENPPTRSAAPYQSPEDVRNQVLGLIPSVDRHDLVFGNPYLLQFFTGQY